MIPRMKWWIVLLVAIGSTVVHFVITFTSMICLLWSALGPANWMGRILASLFIPLGFPATFIIGRWTDGLIGLSKRGHPWLADRVERCFVAEVVASSMSSRVAPHSRRCGAVAGRLARS